ncbi:MAG: T9SS type A sorting domain-containing protein, partial [Bacteroidetes bacterium]|nr:T9SS type A sorting domain-containing protein [Bacteroidota bacterium]
AWTNAGFLSQGQADVLNASAADYCSTASRIAHNQIFTLGQNYPNPTGTNTVIPFTLSASGKVSIQLYDTSGKMIRNLMNQYLHEGAHEVKVNLQSVPAGTYYYKFQVGEYSETLPMVVE